MAATITAVVEPSATQEDPIFLTGRELVVLAAALGLVIGALLLLVLVSGQVTSALFGHG